MAIDWSKAPEGAEFYANGHFRKVIDYECPYKWDLIKWVRGSWTSLECRESLVYSERPAISLTSTEWPETDERITAIAQNGNTGEHYQSDQPKTAVEFLNACAAVQSERGKQYDASGTGERSFAAAASAFNAATGKSLTGSDVCLLLTMVKLVRQYSSPDRLHQDSLLDGVSYLSLWAEELSKELGEK